MKKVPIGLSKAYKEAFWNQRLEKNKKQLVRPAIEGEPSQAKVSKLGEVNLSEEVSDQYV